MIVIIIIIKATESCSKMANIGSTSSTTQRNFVPNFCRNRLVMRQKKKPWLQRLSPTIIGLFKLNKIKCNCIPTPY